jgi:tRNA uridine 5-carbamoylmethylation protein Kti12
MICINLYGGPGVGKSTMAARLFAMLKVAGIKSELVGEFAKDLVYDKAYNIMADQHYLFAQQAHRLWRLKNSGVEVAVCDSPLLLNLAYNQDPNNGYFNQFVIDTYKRYTNFDYVLKRHVPYWELDKRNGDVEDAIQMDKKIDAALLDVWYDFPKKVDISSEGDVIDFAWDVIARVQDTLEEDKFVKELKANKAQKYQDEPWRVA